MKKFRKPAMWLGLICIVLLTGFSIYGAFIGAEKARQFFNSMPLSAYWTAFGLLIAASIVIFPRLLKSPGLLAMHAGCVMIIAGSMWGSFGGHRMQRQIFGSSRVQSARMSIVEGYSEDKMFLDEDLSDEQPHNSIETADFTIKYNYDSQSIDFVSDGRIVRREPVVLEEKIDIAIGDSNYITPLKYFHNLGFKNVDGKQVAFDAPGGGSNPALEVKYVDSDGKESTRLLADPGFRSLPFFIRLNDFRIEYYQQPKIIVVDDKGLVWSGLAEIDKTIDLGKEYGTITPTRFFSNLVYDNGQFKDIPGTAGKPAVEILVDFPGQPQQTRYTRETSENEPEPCIVQQKYAIRMSRTISDYISELEILDPSGNLLACKSIEVNKPLHYGGYHFYQTSYKPFSDGTYATVLSVTSDSGLYCVFAGFALMCGGILYHQWIRPVLKKKKKPEADLSRHSEATPETQG